MEPSSTPAKDFKLPPNYRSYIIAKQRWFNATDKEINALSDYELFWLDLITNSSGEVVSFDLISKLLGETPISTPIPTPEIDKENTLTNPITVPANADVFEKARLIGAQAVPTVPYVDASKAPVG